MKVAKIIDRYTVAVTKAGGPFLSKGDILTIGTEDIVDPETGEVLGKLPQVRIKVTEVHEKFVIAQTYRLTSPYITSRPGSLLRNPLAEVTVKIGDEVRSYEP